LVVCACFGMAAGNKLAALVLQTEPHDHMAFVHVNTTTAHYTVLHEFPAQTRSRPVASLNQHTGMYTFIQSSRNRTEANVTTMDSKTGQLKYEVRFPLLSTFFLNLEFESNTDQLYFTYEIDHGNHIQVATLDIQKATIHNITTLPVFSHRFFPDAGLAFDAAKYHMFVPFSNHLALEHRILNVDTLTGLVVHNVSLHGHVLIHLDDLFYSPKRHQLYGLFRFGLGHFDIGAIDPVTGNVTDLNILRHHPFAMSFADGCTYDENRDLYYLETLVGPRTLALLTVDLATKAILQTADYHHVFVGFGAFKDSLSDDEDSPSPQLPPPVQSIRR
jgi:hypothetical protein